jgi:amino-acid N-acetyltransferase
MIRKAKINEVPAIREFLLYFNEELLPRSLAYLYEHLRDYFIAEAYSNIVGVSALHICWDGWGEIRSLAVAPAHQDQGIGSRLVENCLEEAKVLGIKQVFVLCRVAEFFYKLGFKEIKKEELPVRIWADCVPCHKFPCDEIPMLLML